jgi:hypothetical protein
MNSPNGLDATPMFILLLRELTEIQARCLSNQMLCERILELVGEDAATIRQTVSKIYADSLDISTRQFIERFRAAFPDAPPGLFSAFTE